MPNKVFTNKLYNPNSVQFKDMEKYVCDIVSTVKMQRLLFLMTRYAWMLKYLLKCSRGPTPNVMH